MTPPSSLSRIPMAFLCALCLFFFGCGVAETQSGSEAAGASLAVETPEEEEVVELAVLMGEMHRHSAKLGYSIEGRNLPLVEFYLHELEEVLAEVQTVETYEGMPIAHPAEVILGAAMESLEEVLDGASGDAAAVDWGAAWAGYEATITSCNRCHLATEHGFVHILPAQGEPPFNQCFEVDPKACEPATKG